MVIVFFVLEGAQSVLVIDKIILTTLGNAWSSVGVDDCLLCVSVSGICAGYCFCFSSCVLCP